VILRRKAKWSGHILRSNCLLHDVIEGKVEGSRSSGRKRIQMLDDVKKKTSLGAEGGSQGQGTLAV
jgi:hypothetical protein